LIVAKVLPDSLETQRLLIRSFVAEGTTSAAVGAGRTETIGRNPFLNSLYGSV
jgi:hypothetical protein